MGKRQLTDEDAKAIRYMYKHLGYSQTKLAETFGCNQTNIGYIIKNKTYRDITYDPTFIPDTPLRLHYEKNKEKFGCDTFDEAYKFIKDCPTHKIGSDGSIWTCIKYHWNKLGQHINRFGYIAVNINGKTTMLHRLLAENFLSNPTNLPCVLHFNDCKTDNRLENLRFGTYSDNSQDAMRNGRNNCVFRTTKEYAVHLKRQNPQWSNVTIAKECGISKECVRKTLKQYNCESTAI